MKAALYTCILSKDKEVATQLRQLKTFCALQGWSIVGEYEDHNFDGGADRRQFKAMMADAVQRKFDIVLFWSLDRFSREGAYETHTYLRRLDNAGVRFRSFAEPYLDSCGMLRDAVISIVSVLAKQERVRISDRVCAGLEQARECGTRSGRPIGRPRVVFRRDQALKLREQGLSWRLVSQQLRVSVASVRRACKDVQEPAE